MKKSQRLTCFHCGDGNTPLYCLNCARKGWIAVCHQIDAWNEVAQHPDAGPEIAQIAHREIGLLNDWKTMEHGL